MKRFNYWLFTLAAAGLAGCLFSCSRYLDAIPDKQLAIPSTLEDFRALMDDYYTMNNNYSTAVESMADNYYMLSQNWKSLSAAAMANLYIWNRDENTSTLWGTYVNQIAPVNVVIDGMKTIAVSPAALSVKDHIIGSALFYRAFYHLQIAQLFAPPYVAGTAATDLGIPLRKSSNFNEVSFRSSVQETYEFIIADLTTAAQLLPLTEILKTRPTKAAAYGVLARVCLLQGEYALAAQHAQRSLDHYPADPLMDFNSLDSNAVAPIGQFNKEVIFHCRSLNTTLTNPSRAKIDSNLYRSYHDDDLRRVIYFQQNADGSHRFKGDYDGRGGTVGFVFAGIVADELYLIMAEGYARIGEHQKAAACLNSLMRTRWKKERYTDVQPDDPTLLARILTERRRELLNRGTRWSDLRRLMNDPAFAVTPQRVIDGVVYQLPPNSPDYTLKLPADVINLTNMPQNP